MISLSPSGHEDREFDAYATNISGLVSLSRRSVYHDESAQYTYFRPGVRLGGRSGSLRRRVRQLSPSEILFLGWENFLLEGCLKEKLEANVSE